MLALNDPVYVYIITVHHFKKRKQLADALDMPEL
jgi:hypothetical protein